ncbi:AMIN-like domain-containing (lipo)protein [Streptomyces sp. NPDC001135]
MRRMRATIVALAVAGAGLGVATTAADAATAAPSRVAACPTGWGSGAKGGVATGTVPLKNIRTGRHDCFDRMVFDVPGGGGSIGYYVRYVDRLSQNASGRYIPVRGGAVLDVHIGAPAYAPANGAPTYPGQVGRPLPGVNITGYRTFKDTRFAGSFEGETQIGIGIRARLPFRVIQVRDHLVVDVAHNWTGSR